MAFKIVKHDLNTQFPTDYYLMTNAEAVTYGQTLVLTSGRLTASANDTTMPEFVALRTQAAEATSVTPIPVVRLNEEQQFEVKSTATVAATLIGSKVTLNSGLYVTGTTTNGLFYVDATDGVTTTSTVRGHFRR